MYLAQVDKQLRDASAGKQSLDDLLAEMLARRRSGRPMDEAAWLDVITKALGPKALDAYRAFDAGTLIVPASDTFGPCFRRVVKKLRRYEVGFSPEVLTEPRRIVRNLVPGSNAEAAGLRNGDEIVKPVPQDVLQLDQNAMETLQIRRDEKVFAITYLPRGELVDAYQWERIAGVPSDKCAI